MPDPYKFQMAIHDFQSARQKAGIQKVLARITYSRGDLSSPTPWLEEVLSLEQAIALALEE